MWDVFLLKDDGALRRHEIFVGIYTVAAEVKEGAAVSVSAQAQFSQAAQLVNHISHSTGKMATFEPGFWRLDGSFMLTGSGSGNNIEVGFASSQLSGANGVFAAPPEIVVNLAAEVDIENISMVFDRATGEVMESVRFRAFDGQNRVVLDETIVGNLAMRMSTRGGALGVRRVEMVLLRTATPRRRARVLEIDFGPVLEFGGEDIVSVNNLRQGDEGRGLPVNRLRARIANEGRYNLLDRGSDVRFLKEKLPVEHNHSIVGGVQRQWVHCGSFYLNNWKIKDDYVEFVSYSRGKEIGKSIYRESSFRQFTLGDIARHVAADGGFRVAVPFAMNISPWFPRFFGNISHRAALSLIARAACCLLFEDTRGVFRFLDPLDEAGDFGDLLDFDKMFGAPKIETNVNYNGVMLRESFVSLESGQVTASEEVWGEKDVEIPFDRPIYSGGWARASSGFGLSNVNFSAMYMTGRLQGFGSTDIEIGGNRANFARSDVFYPAPWFRAGMERQPLVVDLPLFLTNLSRIGDVRNWFLARKFALLARRVVCDVNWRQNPSVGPGDMVLVQADGSGRRVFGVVTGSEMDFDRGVLRGRTQVRIMNDEL